MGLLAKLTGQSAARNESTVNKTTKAHFRGVQIVATVDGCCQAADAIAGQRYLADQVPRLPLERCDSSDCRCSYQLFDDRRTDLRRASDIGYDLASELRTSENRRVESGGRRNNDC